MNDYNNIGQWLPKLLQAKGMSVEQLANACKLSRSIVYFYIDGVHKPSENSMIKMCRVLGIPAEEGLRQYSSSKTGRPKGYRPGPKPGLRLH